LWNLKECDDQYSSVIVERLEKELDEKRKIIQQLEIEIQKLHNFEPKSKTLESENKKLRIEIQRLQRFESENKKLQIEIQRQKVSDQKRLSNCF
jgi:cell shape-determining protein MreC